MTGDHQGDPRAPPRPFRVEPGSFPIPIDSFAPHAGSMELATPQITSSTQEDPRPGDAGLRPPPPSTTEERLHRRRGGRMLAGVAAGLADYLDVDPTLVRIGFVALTLLGGVAVPLYLAGWLLIPDEDADLSVAEELLERERIR